MITNMLSLCELVDAAPPPLWLGPLGGRNPIGPLGGRRPITVGAGWHIHHACSTPLA